MRFGRFVFLLLLLLAFSGASAEVFRLPESFAVIESEAFSDVSGVEEIYVPETCVRLAPDAFGNRSLTVYGFRSSAGETFARESGNEFVDVGIYDISYSFDGRPYTLLPIKLNISFDSPVPAEISDITLISAENTLPAVTGENVFEIPGTFDLSVTVENTWTRKTVVFKNALTLCDTKAINEGVERLRFLPNWYYLEPGGSAQTVITVYPEGAEAVLVWENTEPGTVELTGDGLVTAIKPGGAKIRAHLVGREDVKAEVSVNVLSTSRELTMPKRTTDENGLSANMARIYSVENSALTELRAHYIRGDITEDILKARTGIISRAFSSYAFPWMTEQPLPYWKEENSDDGTKNFMPGTVYYGMPYISGDYVQNRTYSAEKAIAEGKFIKNGDVYLFNPDGLISGNYAGSDCSAFVGSCFYTPAYIKDIRTQTLAYSGDFYTLAAGTELIPGDILVSAYSHVVMFLYYADDAHTQVVIIEQGGDEYGTGTVNVNTRSLSYYTGRGYIARRYSSWRYFDYAKEDGMSTAGK